jgi:hypothetical protein
MGDEYCEGKNKIIANEVMKHALKKPMFFPLGEAREVYKIF